MKILLATHQYFPEHVGGTEIYTHGIAKRLLERNIKVAVVTYIESPSSNEKEYIISKIEYDGIKVYRIHYNLNQSPDVVLSEYNNAFIVKLFVKILREYKPSLVHFTHLMKISCATAEVCHRMHIPYIISLTDFWAICPRHILLKWNGKLCNGPKYFSYCLKCFQRTHGIFRHSLIDIPDTLLRFGIEAGNCLSPASNNKTLKNTRTLHLRNKYIKEQLLNSNILYCLSDFQKKMLVSNGYPAERINVLQHGLETKGYEEDHKSNSSDLINMTYIGSIVRHKGVHIIIEALIKSGNLNLHLQIYGDSSGKDSYKEMIRDMASRDERISLSGSVPFEQLGKIYSETDVLLIPSSWYENEPLVVKAAIYTGVPVIGNNIGSIPEMIIEGQNGWLISKPDPDSWANVFNTLSREKLLEIDPQKAEVKSMDENFEEIYSLYKNIKND